MHIILIILLIKNFSIKPAQDKIALKLKIYKKTNFDKRNKVHFKYPKIIIFSLCK